MWRASSEMGLPWVLLRRGLGAVEKLWCPFCGIFQGIRAVSGRSWVHQLRRAEGGEEGGKEGRRAALSKNVDEANKGRSRSFARALVLSLSLSPLFRSLFLRPYRIWLLFNPAIWTAKVPGRTDIGQTNANERCLAFKAEHVGKTYR